MERGRPRPQADGDDIGTQQRAGWLADGTPALLLRVKDLI